MNSPLPSIKKMIVSSFNSAALMDTHDLVEKFNDRITNELADDASVDFPNLQLVVVTAGCIITGTPKGKSNGETEVIQIGEKKLSFPLPIVSIVTKTAVDAYRKKYEIEGLLAENEGCFVLEDVTVQYSADFIVKTSELTVFYDQILAVTLGQKN